MEAFTGNNVLAFAVVALAIIAIWNTVWTGVKNYREARRPRDDEKARLAAVEEHLDNDNKRLKELEDANGLVLRALMQIIENKLDGNHTEYLKQVRDDINLYLINR